MVALTRMEKIVCCLAITVVYRWRILLAALIVLALCILSGRAFAGDTADLIMKAGADYRATLTWTMPGTKAVVNLTGNSYVAQFRSAPYPAGTLYATYSTIVTSASAGQMQLRLSHRQTATLSGKTGVWDLKQTDAAGQVSYRFGGTVKVMPTVTAP